MRKQLSIVSGLFLVSFFWGGAFFYAHAHEGEEHSASYNLAAISIAQDEAADSASLGTGTPKVLPGNPLYFFKNFSRGIRSTVTFGTEKKAELRLQFANEKIVEAQLLLDKGDKTRAAEHLKSYEKDLAGAKGLADKEKFLAQSFKHQGVIDKIEKEAGEEKAADIKDIREKTVRHMAEVIASVEDKELAKNVLISATSEEGSAFKPLRNLEVLKAVEEKVPEQAKDAIRAAQENAVKRFKSDYDKSTEEEKAALTDYIKSAGGDASRYIEAFTENKEVLGEELFKELLLAPSPAASPEPTSQKKVSPTPASKPASSTQSVPKPAKSVSQPAETSKAPPVVEKKEEPKAEVKLEEPKAEIKKETPKPYEGSPPLLY